MTAGPSVWWPMRVEAERWFSDEERANSRRYHRPIERAFLLRAALQLALLVVALITAVTVEPGVGSQIGMVVAAVATPRLMIDGWREYLHEPRFGSAPVSVIAFVLTAAGRVLVDVGLVAIVAWWIDWMVGDAAALAVAAFVAFLVPLVGAVLGPRIVLTTHEAVDVVDGRSDRVAQLADGAGTGSPRLVMLASDAFDGANALVVGTGRQVTVAVSRRLLEGPDELFDHVVGHELVHLRRRHLWSSAVASGSCLAAVAVGSGLVVREVSADGARLPALIITAGLTGGLFRLVLAWLSRAHERMADSDAFTRAPIEPEMVRQLHLDQRADVEPSAVSRWFGAHPPPAERLERVAIARGRHQPQLAPPT